ncbi:MAG: dihydropteroate synthase [Planctomycetota bacterium]
MAGVVDHPSFTVPLAGGGSLDLGGRTLVMGILNVTPDSFSDGGEYVDPDLAVERAHRMVEEGADIVDVGGESTRPGAGPVDADEERRRILPVIEAIAKGLDVPVSVDTRRGGVARDALQAGARIINDVSGLADPLTPAVAARAGASVVLMHMRGTPADMATRTDYGDVTAEVMAELSVSIDRAAESGLPEEAILVDPGIGFAKTAEQSKELIRRLPEFRTLGRPIVAGPSRKSFLATVRDVPPAERVHLTTGAVTACVAKGAHIVRVHDVRAATDAIRAFEACVRA